MIVRAAGVCGILLLAIGCSGGASAGPSAVGYFSAQLSGAQVLHLAGSAAARTAAGPPAAQVVTMSDSRDRDYRTVVISCGGPEPPVVGVHSVGAAAECQALYSRNSGPPSVNLGPGLDQGMVPDTGTFTVTRRSDGEVEGSFTLAGELTASGYPVGPLTLRGTFRAVPGE